MTHNHDLTDIRAAAHGNWKNIHAALGIPAHLLDTHKHQPCPACGGKDRFRYTDFQGNGGFICNQCTPQGGSGFDLLMLVFGLDFGESVKEVARLLGMTNDHAAATTHTPRITPAATPTPTPQRDKQPELLQRWNDAKPIKHNGIVAEYLAGRGLPRWEFDDELPAQIREMIASYWATDTDGKFILLGEYPCMIAAITLPDGTLQGLHHTYFQPNGSRLEKLELNHPQTGEPLPAKKMIARFSGSLKGAAVHMGQADHAGRLLVGEGLETTLAAQIMFCLPAIAALSANGMKNLDIPPNVKELFICADNDHNKTGFNAAHDLAVRAIKQGIIAHIWQPEMAGLDALDEYNRRAASKSKQGATS